MRFCGGGLPTQKGWAVPPPKDRSTLLLKVKGGRKGVGDVVEKFGGDDITKRQGEVACANVVRVLVGIGSPPALGEGGRVGPCQEDWVCKDRGGNQCDDKAWRIGIPSKVGC